MKALMIITTFWTLLLQAVAAKNAPKLDSVDNNSDSDKQDDKPAPVFDELGGLLLSL